MEQVGTVKKYRDGSWLVWIEDEQLRVNVYLQRSGYWNIEYAFSMPRPEWDDTDSIDSLLNGKDMLLSAKELYKELWMDDDEQI